MRGPFFVCLVFGIFAQTCLAMISMLSSFLLNAVFTNDAVVLGLLAGALGLVFYTHSLPQFKRFYTFVPALLMCYFIPAALNSLGIVNGEESNLYFVASRYLLPASLILLCLSIDLKGIYNLGPKAIIMFFAATAGIVIGGPLALWLVGQSNPEVLGGNAPDAYWRGLSTVAGSWIGGGANQAALKEISDTLDDQFSIMLIVDVFVANLWMPFLLFGAGIREKIDGWLKADASAVNELQDKVEQLQAKSARIMIIEDDSMMRNLIRSVLSYDGYTQIQTVSNAPEALAIAQSNPPEIVVCDWKCQT